MKRLGTLSLREAFLMTGIVCIGLAWWIDHRHAEQSIRELTLKAAEWRFRACSVQFDVSRYYKVTWDDEKVITELRDGPQAIRWKQPHDWTQPIERQRVVQDYLEDPYSSEE